MIRYNFLIIYVILAFFLVISIGLNWYSIIILIIGVVIAVYFATKESDNSLNSNGGA